MYPTLFNGLTNWDDKAYLTNNRLVKFFSWDALAHILWVPHEDLYKPLVFLTYALEYKLFGMNPFFYHLTNYLFHLCNTALVFWFMWRLTRGQAVCAFVVSLLFGIHPMHVESVAWVSERKDMLVAFFYFGSLITYLYWTDTRKYSIYALSLVCLFFSFLAKPMGVMLPFLLILLDWYRGRRWDRGALVDKLPYLAIAFFFGAYNVFLHLQIGKMKQLFGSLPGESFLVACHGILFYLAKLFWPVNLSAYYLNPVRENVFLPIVYYLAPLAVGALLIATVTSLHKTKHVVFGVLFFLISLFPTIQFISTNALMVIADRYTYIPYVGLFFLIWKAVEWLYENSKGLLKEVSVAFLMCFLIFCGGLTWQRSHDWKDSLTLWQSSLRQYPENSTFAYFVFESMLDKGWLDRSIEEYPEKLKKSLDFATPYFNRGIALLKAQRYAEAEQDFNKSLEINPELISAYVNRGFARDALDRPEEAIKDFTVAIERDPEYALAYANRGHVYYQKLNDPEAALKDYNRAVELKALNPGVFNNRATLLAELDRNDEAIADYGQAIKRLFGYGTAHFNRGHVFYKMGRLDDAIRDFRQTIRFMPRFGGGYLMLARCYVLKHELLEALKPLDLLLKIRPDYLLAYSARGSVYYESALYERAVADFTSVIKNAPGHAGSYYRRGLAFEKMGRISEARADWARAYRIDPKITQAAADLTRSVGPDIEKLRKQIQNDPKNAELYYRRGNLYADSFLYEESLKDFDEAIRLDPKFITAYNDRGSISIEMGDLERALTNFNKALQLDPSCEPAKINRDWVVEKLKL